MIMEILWDLVALIGLFRACLLVGESIKDKRALGEVRNGRKRLANEQIEGAVTSVFMWLFLLIPGVLALAYHLGLTSLKERLSLVPFFLVAALLVFFFGQERHAAARRRQLAGYNPISKAEQIDKIEEVTHDINVKVTEMQARGQDDQPKEETDRREGREHRDPAS